MFSASPYRFLHSCIVLALLCLALASCKPSLPDGILSRGKMEDILYDYHIAQCLAEEGDSADIRRMLYVQAVFRKHGITEAEFDSSMVWYSGHSSELRDIYANLEERLGLQAMALGAGADDEFATFSVGGDTANLWRDRMFYCLQGNRTDRMMEFTVPADTGSHLSDEYLWRFDARFVQKDGTRDAIAALVMRYEGDSVTATTRTIHNDGRIEIRMSAADSLQLNSVSGYIYNMRAFRDGESSFLLVSKPVLIRFRKTGGKKRGDVYKGLLKADIKK